MRTRTRQDQIRKSDQPQDTLPLEYQDLKTLEDDLNYIRSVIKDFKGTQNYDSPVLDHLEDVQAQLASMLEGGTLYGVKAETKPLEDNSQAIATTEFVHAAIGASTDLGDLHRHFVKNDSDTSEWLIVHEMKKFPSVQFLDSSGREKIVEVIHHDIDSLTIVLGKPRTGRAILN